MKERAARRVPARSHVLLVRGLASLAALCWAIPDARPSASTSGPAFATEQEQGVRAPRVLWHFADGAMWSEPVLEGSQLWYGGADLVRLDADTGEVTGRHSIDVEGTWRGRVTLVPGGVIATHSSGVVACLSRDLTKVRWTWDAEAVHPGALVERPDGSALYVVPTGGEVVALAVDSGRPSWSVDAGGRVEMVPATDGERVLLGTEKGRFLAVAAEDGREVWVDEGRTKYGWTDPVVADGVVYVGDRGVGGSHKPSDAGSSVTEVTGNRAGALNAFRSDTGERLWGTIFGATGLSDPFVSGDRVWVGFGRMVAPFRRETGEALWTEGIRTGRNPFGSPRAIGDDVVFGNLDGRLYVYERASKELRWAFHVPGAQVGAWVHDGARIFVTTTKGLFALGNDPGGQACAPGMVVVWREDRATESSDGVGEQASPGRGEADDPDPLIEEALAGMHAALARLIEAERAQREGGGDPEPGLVRRLRAVARSLEERAAALQAKAPQAPKQARAPKPTRAAEIRALSEEWTRVMLATGEGAAAERDALLVQMREALAGDDPVQRDAALRTLTRSSEVAFDRAPLRPLILALAQDAEGTERVSALYALYNTSREDAEVELVHAAWDALPRTGRESIPHLLYLFGGGVIEGRSEEIVLEILANVDGRSFRESGLNGLMRARVSDRLAGRLIDLATGADPELRRQVIYSCLSTFDDKNEAIVDLLVDALVDPDSEVSGRALWGLGHGIRDAQRPKVVRALVALRDARTSQEIRVTCERLIAKYGG